MSLVLRSVVIAVLGGLGAATWMGVRPAAGIETPAPAALAASPRAVPLAPVGGDAARKILDRSPFSATRAAFSRLSGPPPPPLDIRLTGISKLGRSLRASLQINGQKLTVAEGDATPAGPVLSVEAEAITFAGPPERRVELFKKPGG